VLFSDHPQTGPTLYLTGWLALLDRQQVVVDEADLVQALVRLEGCVFARVPLGPPRYEAIDTADGER